MAPRLVLEGASGRRVVPLPEGTTTAVGRGPAGNVLRLEERNVSRRHACFHTAGGAVTVEDLGSLTGTFVNGERLDGPRRLRPGDRVRIGAFVLALEDGTGDPVPEAVTEGAPPALPHRSTPPPTLPLPDLSEPPPPGGLRRAVTEVVRKVRALAGRVKK